MSNKPKASVHVKPCNIAQSELHNRRDPEYIKKLDPNTLYVRLDLTKHNASYVAPEMQGVSLQQHLESIRAMVKKLTKRAMQEKDVKYTDKNGKVRTRNGASPIRESVVVIEKDTKLKDLLNFTKEVEKKWGIKALQVHIHRDEGHCEVPGDEKTWVPNYHAHIIWDWMDHSTGKSIKLNADDMSEMQDMVAEALDMERGQKKSETGLDHLEREQFIKLKLEKEKKQLEEEKRKAQSEKDKAEKKAQEAKEEAKKAVAEKDEAEKKAQKAKTALSSAESKITEKQIEIDRLKQRIDIEQVALEGLQSEVEEKRREKDSINTSDEWMNPALRAVSGYLFNTDKVIKFAVETIQDYAYSGTGGRGGNHGDCFYDNEAFVIKKLMTGLAAIAKTTFQVIGNWLVYVASRIAKFNDWELNRAERGVKSIADGEYDWRIDRFERRQGGGISR
jgi:hypothetical protein